MIVRTMSTADLERLYDLLADAVDRAGEKERLFLAKLALALACAVGDLSRIEPLIETALNDL